MSFSFLLTAFGTSGVWAALYPTGRWLLDRAGVARLSDMPRATMVGTAIAAGVAVWSLVMLGTLWIGAFSPLWLGTLGWFVVVLAGVGARRTLGTVDRPVMARGAVVITLVAGAAILYGVNAAETPLGNRDEGIYTARATQLARTGTDHIESPVRDALDAALHRPYLDGEMFVFPGIYAGKTTWTYQFSALPSLWIAQSYAALGDAGLYRASAAFAALGLLVFLGLARTLFAAPLAAVLLPLFALNPAQVWIARMNLSEPLAQVLALGAMSLAVTAVQRKHAGTAAVAVLVFSVAVLARIDLVVMLPSMAFAWLIHRLASNDYDGGDSRTWGVLVGGATGAGTLALAGYGIMSLPYLTDNASWIGAAGGVALAPLAAVAGVSFLPASRRSSLAVLLRRLARPIAICLLLAFTYATLLRPGLEPFALIDRPGSPLDGLRDYRENSLPNLAAYLTWPVLLLAGIGLAISAMGALRGERGSSAPLLAAVFGGTLIVLLARPGIAPDHFWAIRRFVPLAIPGVIVLAGVAVMTFVARWKFRIDWPAASAVTAAVATIMIALQWPTLSITENRGLTDSLRSLRDGVAPATLYLLRNGGMLGAPLLASGARVLPWRDSPSYDPGADASILRRECTDQRPCRLVHDDMTGLSGLRISDTHLLSLHREYVERTYTPLPRRAVVDDSSVLVSNLAGVDTTTARSAFGQRRDWRLAEAGLYATELGPGWSMRWTNGAARLSVPSVGAQRIEFRLNIPTNVPDFRMHLAINGTTLFDGMPPAGIWIQSFPLPALDPPGMLNIALDSTTFVPAQLLGSDDPRELGAGILAIRLLPGGAESLGPNAAGDAYRSRIVRLDGPRVITIPEGTSASVPLTVANTGPLAWPTAADTTAPVRLGILWFAEGASNRVSEQRVDFAFGLLPGETTVLAAPLYPSAAADRRLPPGRYRVLIGPVAEGVAWFYLRGDPALELEVFVSPAAN